MRKLLFFVAISMMAVASQAAALNVTKSYDVLDLTGDMMGIEGTVRTIGAEYWTSSFQLEPGVQMLLTTHHDGVVAEVIALDGDQPVFHFVPLVSGETTAVDLSGLPDTVSHIFVMMERPVMVTLFEDEGKAYDLRLTRVAASKETMEIVASDIDRAKACPDTTICSGNWKLTCNPQNSCNGVNEATRYGKMVLVKITLGGQCLTVGKLLTWGCHSGSGFPYDSVIPSSSSQPCGCDGTAQWTLSSGTPNACPVSATSNCHPNNFDWNWNVTIQ